MEWTEERVEALKTLWTTGNTASEVSRRLGVTRNAVIGKVHRLGLGRRHSPAAPRAIAVQTPRRTREHSSWTGAATPTAAAPPAIKRADTSDFVPTANLLTLNPQSCRWPIGHPNDPEFGFCGRERQANASYCADHRKVAFRRSSFSTVEVKRLAGG
jgi:GcrA cell cycle regulator